MEPIKLSRITIDDIMNKKREAILRIRRAICGPGYDKVCKNMMLKNNNVCLYINREKKIAFISNVENEYIEFEEAEVLYNHISKEKADAIADLLKDRGEINDVFHLSHRFYI